MIYILYTVNAFLEDGMRVSKDEKDRSRARIVASASRMFREQGVAGTSVGEVMNKAGMTHGGFYRHFESKEALLTAALDDAFAQMVAVVAAGVANQPAEEVRRAFRSYYLSDEHVANPGEGCPAAALSGDIGRESAELKSAFGAGVRSMTAVLSHAMEGSEPVRHAKATRELAMMIGAVVMARASDAETALQILSDCASGDAEKAKA